MPSVGTRRSTRVFVPKSVKSPPDADGVRVLRSGKRLMSDVAKAHSDDDDWLRLLGSPGVEASDFRRWNRESRSQDEEMAEAEVNSSSAVSGDAGLEGPVPDSADEALPVDREGIYGIVYTRKRRRPEEAKDRMFGIQFVRKQRRKKAVGDDKESGFFSNGFRGFVCRWTTLVIFVEFSCNSLRRFEKFFLSVLKCMKRSKLGVPQFTAFLFSETISGLFSRHGIHFFAECSSRNHRCCSKPSGGAFSSAGICSIYRAPVLDPLFSVNFSALPSSFMRFHMDMVLGSFYVPPLLAICLRRWSESAQGDIVGSRDSSSNVPLELGIYEGKSEFPAESSLVRNVVDYTRKATVSRAPNRQGPKLRRHKKRNSIRFGRAQRHPLSAADLNRLNKLPSAAGGVTVAPGLIDGLFDSRDDYYASPSPRNNLRQRKSPRGNPYEKIRELKSALVDLKQNIDSVKCAANILLVQSDRCLREQGAEVILENAGSKEWCLAIKTQGITRYLHKAQEMRPSTSNRFTHAMMWGAEDGWKLEFCERRDWMIFKELHRECCERNSQATAVRIIPVPGVQEVVGYYDGDHCPFVRPDVYISVKDDELQRALKSDNLYYDMDSGDEEWLEQLNCDFGGNENFESAHISKDNFEKILYAFEKAAYSRPEDVSEESKATNLCLDLGRQDMLCAVFDYWLKKRKQKKSPLVRAFHVPEGSALKRAQLVQKPVFRKRRSFKRQTSQLGRARSEIIVDAGAMEDASRRVREAKQAANRAVEFATAKRNRAQMLMHNADLLAYKSVMTVMIAQAAEQGSPHATDAPTSLILLD